MIKPSCIEAVTVSKIKVSENGRTAVVLNPGSREFLRIKIDGCLEIEGPRADWVLEQGRRAVVIELKGRGVEHGADQISATARLWVNDEKRADEICGLIVAAQYPRSSTSIQIKQNRFAKSYSRPLHVVTRNSEFEFDKLFSFKGPFKA